MEDLKPIKVIEYLAISFSILTILSYIFGFVFLTIQLKFQIPISLISSRLYLIHGAIALVFFLTSLLFSLLISKYIINIYNHVTRRFNIKLYLINDITSIILSFADLIIFVASLMFLYKNKHIVGVLGMIIITIIFVIFFISIDLHNKTFEARGRIIFPSWLTKSIYNFAVTIMFFLCFGIYYISVQKLDLPTINLHYKENNSIESYKLLNITDQEYILTDEKNEFKIIPKERIKEAIIKKSK